MLYSHTGNERRIRLLSNLAGKIADDVEEQHRELIEAIASGDKARAVLLDQEHLSKIEDEYAMLMETFPQYFIK